MYVWETADFRIFDDLGLVPRADVPESSDTIEISDAEADMIACALPTVTSDKPATFPLIEGFADPVIMARDGCYYFIATNDVEAAFLQGGDVLRHCLSGGRNPKFCQMLDDSVGRRRMFFIGGFPQEFNDI